MAGHAAWKQVLVRAHVPLTEDRIPREFFPPLGGMGPIVRVTASQQATSEQAYVGDLPHTTSPRQLHPYCSVYPLDGVVRREEGP
jgi:hypothetical protein